MDKTKELNEVERIPLFLLLFSSKLNLKHLSFLCANLVLRQFSLNLDILGHHVRILNLTILMQV